MCSRFVLSLGSAVILLGASASPPGASFPHPDGWPIVTTVQHAVETLGPGVTYERWQLATAIGPLVVHVTTIDTRNPAVSLAVATHHDAIVGSGEPLSSMADRAHAEAAINADYFDINETNAPLNIVAVRGRFLHQPDGAAALVIGANNAVTMGPISLQATLADAAGASVRINSINDWTTGSALSLLTSEYGGDADADLEVVLTPDPSGGYRVRSVAQAIAHIVAPAPSDVAIVARGAEQVGRLSAFAPNDIVTLTFSGAPDPASIASAVGGGPLLLHDGKPVADPASPAAQETDVRYPVTGAGLSADGATLWLVAVDGRAPDRSVGITRPMLASLFAGLGAAQAMAFDSGGSTEMAVRHLGDPTVSVANVPSDGKERSIADALVVLNAATPGPLAHVLVRAFAPAVLVGSHVMLRAAGVDANLQPVALDPTSVRFAVDRASFASVDAVGSVTGMSPGNATITARASGIASDPVALAVVPSVDVLTIAGYGRVAPSRSAVPLSIAASTSDGRPVAVDARAVRWSATGDGTISANGVFVGGAATGIATVTARAGAALASLRVLVGEHPVALQPVPKAGPAPGTWRFSASPSTVSGAVDDAVAPDGAPALHLDYGFSEGGSTRAAFAETTLPVAGQPLAISVDVYGDGNGEWLRGAYRNADGIVDSVTIARHVDWSGWKTLRIAIPLQVRWPIAWTRLYAVEPRRDAIESGDLWFRNLTGLYAGPSGPATTP